MKQIVGAIVKLMTKLCLQLMQSMMRHVSSAAAVVATASAPSCSSPTINISRMHSLVLPILALYQTNLSQSGCKPAVPISSSTMSGNTIAGVVPARKCKKVFDCLDCTWCSHIYKELKADYYADTTTLPVTTLQATNSTAGPLIDRIIMSLPTNPMYMGAYIEAKMNVCNSHSSKTTNLPKIGCNIQCVIQHICYDRTTLLGC